MHARAHHYHCIIGETWGVGLLSLVLCFLLFSFFLLRIVRLSASRHVTAARTPSSSPQIQSFFSELVLDRRWGGSTLVVWSEEEGATEGCQAVPCDSHDTKLLLNRNRAAVGLTKQKCNAATRTLKKLSSCTLSNMLKIGDVYSVFLSLSHSRCAQLNLQPFSCFLLFFFAFSLFSRQRVVMRRHQQEPSSRREPKATDLPYPTTNPPQKSQVKPGRVQPQRRAASWQLPPHGLAMCGELQRPRPGRAPCLALTNRTKKKSLLFFFTFPHCSQVTGNPSPSQEPVARSRYLSRGVLPPSLS